MRIRDWSSGVCSSDLGQESCGDSLIDMMQSSLGATASASLNKRTNMMTEPAGKPSLHKRTPGAERRGIGRNGVDSDGTATTSGERAVDGREKNQDGHEGKKTTPPEEDGKRAEKR